MMRGGTRNAVKQYQQAGLQAQVHDATPHQLIQMMFEGALGAIAAARGALASGEPARKGEQIGRAIGFVEGLRVSLDKDRGGELAVNFEALYEYIARRLLEANLRNEDAILAEVASLLRELDSGWRELGELLVRHTPQAQG